MTQIKDLDKLPILKLEVPLYETSKPFEEDGIGKTFWTTFTLSNCDVTAEGFSLGSICGAVNGGLFVRFNLKNGERLEYFLAPDDIWMALVDKLNLNGKIGVPLKVWEERTRPAPPPEEDEEDEEDEDDEETEEDVEEEDHDPVPPDWSKDGYVLRDAYDIPKPWIWKFPHVGVKRKVTFRIMRYRGQKHFWLSIHEERNHIWDSQAGCWVTSYLGGPGADLFRGRVDSDFWREYENWPSKDGPGFEMLSYKACISLMKRIIKDHFPSSDYEVIIDDYEGDNRHPEREGD